MAKKGFDIKAFMLNHAEKLGATLIGLLGLTGLATASWKTCEKDPVVLVQIAEKTKSEWLGKNPIPEEKVKELAKTPDVEALALRMASPNEDIAKFSTSRRWNPPIHEVQEKLATVIVNAPEDPEANLIMLAMVETPDEETDEAESAKESDSEKDKGKSSDEPKSESTEELEKIFGQKNAPAAGAAGDLAGGGLPEGGGLGSGMGSGRGMGGPGMGMASSGSGMAPPGGPAMGSSGSGRGRGGPGMGMGGPGMGMGGPGMGMGGPGMGMGGPGMGMGGPGMGMGGPGMGMGGPGMGGMDPSDGSMEGYGSYGMGVPTEKKVRLVTGVSVRLVFDLRDQMKKVAEALHLPESDAGRYIDFVNLQIERKRAVVGADPWAGQWEPLTLDEIGEILELSYGTDPDIVQPAVIRPEITMPLPRRRSGEWTPANASHKRLEEFQLSAEEKEVIELHKQKMLEEAQKLKAMLPREQAKSEGFRRYGLGAQDLQNSLGGGASDSVTDSMFDALSDKGEEEENTEDEKNRRKDPRFKDKKALRDFLNRQLAAQRLLLVRFMDFTCDRGTSYQYRVRLEMRNPNFDRPIDELEEPEQADLQTIFSAWSEPSPGVYVPHGYRYYPHKVAQGEAATLTMLYENESAGTPVLAHAIQVPVGTRIGGKASVDVVDLGKDTLKVEEVEMKSKDFLASVTEVPRFSKGDFPELKAYLSTVQKPFGERITVVDSNGAIVVRFAGDSISVGSKKMTALSDREFIKGLLEIYKDWRETDAPSAFADPYGGPMGEGSGMGSGGMGMGSGGMGMGSGGYGDYQGGMSDGSAASGRGRGGRGRGGRGSGGSGSGSGMGEGR